MIKKISIRLIILVLIGILISACGTTSLDVTDVWGRPGQVGGNSAAYFKIKNKSFGKDTLLSASADISQAVELHMSMMSGEGTNQQMQMVPQEFVEIAGFKTVEFKPGGLHVMFVNLNKDLKPGDSYKLTLQFENAGSVELQVTVREP